MRVAIIGAGVAGLVTAKVLKQDGFEVTMFEKEPAVGGVWAPSRAYPGLSTNNPRETYVFSDFPHDEETGDFPTAAEVRAYLEDYVEHFGLQPHLRLETEVCAVARGESGRHGEHGGFELTIQALRDVAEPETVTSDFLVVCNGVHSEPFVPQFGGIERFAGPVLHSSQTPEALRHRRVLVVGAGKSALDCANYAGQVAAKCTLVFRRPYWMLPRYFFGRKRVDRQVFNRVTEMVTFPAYHTLPRGEAVLRRAGTPLLPLLWLYRRIQCRLVARQARIPPALVPDTPIHQTIYHQGIGSEVYDGIRAGRVITRRAEIDRIIDGENIRLDTGETIAADVIICGTGWRNSIGFLEPELREAVAPDGRFRLYRNVLPPAEPRMGLIGYASSGNTPLTSEVAAHWLSACFSGELALPEREVMEHSVDQMLAWTARVFPEQPGGHFIGGHIAHYVDWLLCDMGLSPRREKGLAKEYLGPLWAERYSGLAKERRSVLGN